MLNCLFQSIDEALLLDEGEEEEDDGEEGEARSWRR